MLATTPFKPRLSILAAAVALSAMTGAACAAGLPGAASARADAVLQEFGIGTPAVAVARPGGSPPDPRAHGLDDRDDDSRDRRGQGRADLRRRRWAKGSCRRERCRPAAEGRRRVARPRQGRTDLAPRAYHDRDRRGQGRDHLRGGERRQESCRPTRPCRRQADRVRARTRRQPPARLIPWRARHRAARAQLFPFPLPFPCPAGGDDPPGVAAPAVVGFPFALPVAVAALPSALPFEPAVADLPADPAVAGFPFALPFVPGADVPLPAP